MKLLPFHSAPEPLREEEEEADAALVRKSSFKMGFLKLKLQGKEELFHILLLASD